eukprot:871313-Pelagomonas_calceolata.AAC.14
MVSCPAAWYVRFKEALVCVCCLSQPGAALGTGLPAAPSPSLPATSADASASVFRGPKDISAAHCCCCCRCCCSCSCCCWLRSADTQAGGTCMGSGMWGWGWVGWA